MTDEQKQLDSLEDKPRGPSVPQTIQQVFDGLVADEIATLRALMDEASAQHQHDAACAYASMITQIKVRTAEVAIRTQTSVSSILSQAAFVTQQQQLQSMRASKAAPDDPPMTDIRRKLAQGPAAQAPGAPKDAKG